MLSIVRLSGLCSIWDRELLPSAPTFHIVDGLIDATSKDWACPRGAIKKQIATATASPADKHRGAVPSILMDKYYRRRQFRVGLVTINDRSYRKCTGPNVRLRLGHPRRRTSDKIYRLPGLIGEAVF